MLRIFVFVHKEIALSLIPGQEVAKGKEALNEKIPYEKRFGLMCTLVNHSYLSYGL